MKDAREVEFLAWFQKQTPKRPAPLPGVGGLTPGLPNNMPDRPDASLSKFIENLGTGAPVPPPTSFPPPATAAPSTIPPEATNPDAPKSTESTPADVPPTAPDTGEKKQPE
jgi:hypothetical protein